MEKQVELILSILYPTNDWCFMKTYAMLKLNLPKIIEKMYLLIKNVMAYLCNKM